MNPLQIPALGVLAASVLAVPAAVAQSFQLNDSGNKVGAATYTIDAAGRSLKAHFAYTVDGTTITVDRKAGFDAQWEQLSETDSASAGTLAVTYTVAPSADKTKLNFDVTAAGQTFHKDFAAQPRTVALANFDPSGLQVLLNLMAVNPHPQGEFYAFAPMGRGALVAASLTPAAATAATLDGKPMTARHWTVTLAGVQMEIYANQNGDLLAADIPAQKISYVRDGFTLPTATQAPPK